MFGKSRFPRLLAAAVCVLLLAIVQAEAQQDDCFRLKGDAAIAACTRDIQSGRYVGRNLAITFSNRGNAYRQKREFDRAIADHNEAIRLDPKYAAAFSNRGNAYRDKREFDRAIADFNEAIRLDPKDAVAFSNRGNAYSDKREFDRAIADYNEAIRLDPQYALAFYNRGAYYHGKREFDRAIADFNEAIRLDPRHAIAFNNRGNAYHRKGDFDRAIADFNEVIRLNPQYAEAFNGRCWARATGNRDLEQALADCNRAIELKARYHNALDSRGLVNFRLGRLDAAILDYSAALNIDPKKADSLYVRGLARLKKGDSAAGEADIAAAKTINPKIHETYAKWGVGPDGGSQPAAAPETPKTNLGTALPGGTHPAEGEPKVTIASLSEAIRNNPRDLSSYFFRGRLYSDQGEIDRAIADFSQAIRLNPSPTSSDALLRRGELYEEKGEFIRAIADYTAWMRGMPKDYHALGRRCFSRAAANRELAQALIDCNEAIASFDARPEHHTYRGFVYFRLGRFGEAINDFMDAGFEADAFYLMGITFLRRGNKVDENEHIESAKNLDPDIAQKYARMGVKP